MVIMELGLLINTTENKIHAIGLVRAALEKGWSARLFVMDQGTRLLEDPEFSSLADLDAVTISFCEFNARQLGINLDQVSRKIKKGTQLNNAIMCNKADRVLVL